MDNHAPIDRELIEELKRRLPDKAAPRKTGKVRIIQHNEPPLAVKLREMEQRVRQSETDKEKQQHGNQEDGSKDTGEGGTEGTDVPPEGDV